MLSGNSEKPGVGRNILRAVIFLLLHFLKHLVRSFTGKLYITLNNYSIHKTAAIQKFCQSQVLRLELLFSPTSYPQNQPVERSWETCKTRINANQVLQELSRTGLHQFQHFAAKPEAL